MKINNLNTHTYTKKNPNVLRLGKRHERPRQLLDNFRHFNLRTL